MVGLKDWDTLKSNHMRIVSDVIKDGNLVMTLKENFWDITPEDWFYKKVFMAHAPNDIINENIAIEDVAEKYHISKSRLQSLQSDAETFAKNGCYFLQQT